MVLYADLDGLKRINDSMGHHEGDRALIKTAEILKDTFRTSDIVARLGGDEFVVLAAIGKEETADSLTARLQERFEICNSKANVSYQLSISVGVVHFDEDTSLEEVTAQADRIMYEDKRRKHSRGVLPLEPIRPRIEAVA